jgi:hypothetical protein
VLLALLCMGSVQLAQVRESHQDVGAPWVDDLDVQPRPCRYIVPDVRG